MRLLGGVCDAASDFKQIFQSISESGNKDVMFAHLCVGAVSGVSWLTVPAAL